MDYKRESQAEVEILRDGSSKKNLWNNKKRPKGGMLTYWRNFRQKRVWNFTGTSTDLFRARVSHGKDRYPHLLHGYTHGHQPRGRPRNKWLDNIILWRLKSNCAPSVAPCKQQNDMEEHISAAARWHRLVAGALCQVTSSQITSYEGYSVSESALTTL